ncbi:hypothetical protein [Bacillus sp. V59.32b]|uniref:hypothetical protein n=1 Tax=Bacillus sp. V59.32b TaxID=1758642 RepID=UPI000E3CF6A0|nr:hypothetical protein [Bacillus sp. V59.32b]RFU64610.1 hypothetical protein D0463_09955 [Bacillus sp. V59.32b]
MPHEALRSEDGVFEELRKRIGEEILIITVSPQLNLLGQTFRPIFCGTIVEVERGHMTLFPVNIRLVNAPFFQFPTPLSIPLEKGVQATFDFSCDEVFPLV